MTKKRVQKTILTPLIGLALLLAPAAAGFAQADFTPEPLQDRVQNVYQETHESVANITTKALSLGMFNMPTTQEGAGSGFLYDDEGHVVTNFHVVRNAKTITVSLGRDQVYEAEVVGTDPLTDLAVLELEDGNLPEPIPMGNSDGLEVGEFVIALGNPFSFERTLTFGVISALGRGIRSPQGSFISEAIQTDTPINPGNSGGPLLNMDGEVIGVNSAIISPSGASAGIGFAISANTVDKVVTSLIETGSYPHPWLGIRPINLTPGFKRLLERANQDVAVDKGLLIVQVLDGGPADEAGLQGGQRQLRIGNRRLLVGGDIIVGVDGREVENYKDLLGYLENEVSIGETVRITYYRDGDKRTTRIEVGERPSKSRDQ